MMGCSKNTGYSGIRRKAGNYRRPCPSQFKPMQILSLQRLCIKGEDL